MHDSQYSLKIPAIAKEEKMKHSELLVDNFRFHTIIKLLLVMILVYNVAGCAASPYRVTGEYIWPPPPDIARIKWVRQWFQKYDFGQPNKILDVLIGEEPGVRLRRPNGVVSDSAGNVYVADQEHRIVFVFDQEQNRLRFLGEGLLAAPVSLAINNKKGVLFVSDSGLHKVLGIDKNSGKLIFDIGGGQFKNPSGMVYDEDRNRLYISDTKNNMVRVYDENGKPLFTIGKKGTDDGEFHFPSYLAVDKKGNLYVVDSFNFRIQIFDPAGSFVRKFGKLGDTSGSFSRPAGIGVDSEGHIYVVDSAFNNFQIFNEEGKLLLWVGQGGGKPGEFSLPSGMYIDNKDLIYVSDTFNRRVQVFQYLKEKQ